MTDCIVCGLTITGRPKTAVTCSPECGLIRKREKSRQYIQNKRDTCPDFREKAREAARLWYAENKEKAATYASRPDVKAKQAAYRRTDRFRKANAARRRKQRADSPSVRIAENLRRRMNRALTGKVKDSTSAVRSLGCSVDHLKERLEAMFTEGMSWDNYGEWHIDHIKPLASFDLTDPEEVKKACHYTNLQPLWAKDNFSKGGRV